MDFDLSERQEILRKSARDFLEKECPIRLVREMDKHPDGFPRDLWLKMAGLGWQGLMIPEEYGGNGSSFLDLVVILEEMGRALAPGPFVSTVVLGALPILWAGTEDQKNEFLPRIARGDTILTMSVNVNGNGNVAWTPTDSGATLSGRQIFVADAHLADHVLCVAGQENGRDGGTAIFLVDTAAPGVERTPLRTIGLDRQCEVVMNEVALPPDRLLAGPRKAPEVVRQTLELAAVAQCAFMLGAARRAMELTVSYVKERSQYGRPIGSFQAVQHRCADMAADVLGSEYVTYQAAWKLDQGLPTRREVAVAKAWVSEACRRTCALACYLHGALGYSEEYDTQLYLRRVTAAAIAFGDAAHHRKAVAADLLD